MNGFKCFLVAWLALGLASKACVANDISSGGGSAGAAASSAAAPRQQKCTTVQRCGAKCRPCQAPANGKALCVKLKANKQAYACSVQCKSGFVQRTVKGSATCRALPRYLTGLQPSPDAAARPRNATLEAYAKATNAALKLRSTDKTVTTADVARMACNSNTVGSGCGDILLLALTPQSYSSNNTADTAAGLAYISPAQDQGACAACVAFVAAAAAEAAISIYKQQSWNKLSLSEQDLAFCKLSPVLDCSRGASYQSLVRNVGSGKLSRLSSQTCFGYTGRAQADCKAADNCPSQLSAGTLNMANSGKPLQSIGSIKEQIMLTGGVLASMYAYSSFKDFKASRTVDVYDTQVTARNSEDYHAVFCYGWSDVPGKPGQGHWLCKNSWGQNWGGQNGNFKIAYGAAYVMDAADTYAMRFGPPSAEAATAVNTELSAGLTMDPDAEGCLAYTPQGSRLLRLIALYDKLRTLNEAAAGGNKLQNVDILADLLASNIGYMPDITAASKVPLRICGQAKQMVASIAPEPSPSPPPVATSCSGLPPSAKYAAVGWPEHCSGLTAGLTCQLNCAANATGPGYTATCTANGTWTTSGDCSLNTCPDLPPSQANTAAGWNASCANTTVGGICQLGCAVNATGTGYTATCTAESVWAVFGSCSVRTCPGTPALPSTAASTWGDSCANATVGSTCSVPCAANSTGTGYNATCELDGRWTVSGNCTLITCPGLPGPAANSGQAWSTNCSSGAAVGTVCQLGCAANATGGGYLAECSGNGTWSLSGSCTLRVCPGLPALPGLTASGWNDTCANGSVGASCGSILCSANATGSGYTAQCDSNGTWAVNGSCALKRCLSLPPVPPNARSGWNATCANAAVGSTCQVGCAANAMGTGYSALCSAKEFEGSWTVNGSCSLIICEGAPPLQPNAMSTWATNQGPRCANATVGSLCRLGCALNSTGDGYTAICTPAGEWSVSSTGCTLRRCMGLPMVPTRGSLAGWDPACAGSPVGATCKLGCADNAVGDGYTSSCTAIGDWALTGECSLMNPRLALLASFPTDYTGPPANLTAFGRSLCVTAPASQLGTDNISLSAPDARSICGADNRLNTGVYVLSQSAPPGARFNSWACYDTTLGALDGPFLGATIALQVGQSAVCVAAYVTVCQGSPTIPPNAAASWNVSCVDAFVGTSCFAACTANAVGSGYTATCSSSGNWSVIGDCAAKTCSGVPPQPGNTATAWAANCTNATAGSSCRLSCAANSTGPGYTGICSSSGTWTVSGNCTLNPIRMCSGLSSWPPNAATGWNSSCANVTAGTVCQVGCASNAVGQGYRATCTALGTWAVTGGCTLKPPTLALISDFPAAYTGPSADLQALGPSSCTVSPSQRLGVKNVTIVAPGPGVCWADGTWEAGGYQLVQASPIGTAFVEWSCYDVTQGTAQPIGNAGFTLLPGRSLTCVAVYTTVCLGQPLAPPETATGWLAGCTGLPAGSTCRASCLFNATGNGYDATCDEAGSWSVTGSCEWRRCPGLPALQALMDPAWNPNCANATVGTVCSAACAANAIGVGYNATCILSGNWAVAGSCRPKF